MILWLIGTWWQRVLLWVSSPHVGNYFFNTWSMYHCLSQHRSHGPIFFIPVITGPYGVFSMLSTLNTRWHSRNFPAMCPFTKGQKSCRVCVCCCTGWSRSCWRFSSNAPQGRPFSYHLFFIYQNLKGGSMTLIILIFSTYDVYWN